VRGGCIKYNDTTRVFLFLRPFGLVAGKKRSTKTFKNDVPGSFRRPCAAPLPFPQRPRSPPPMPPPTVCTFEARLAPGCVCAVSLRRAADGSGGGGLFPSASLGLNAFACSPDLDLGPLGESSLSVQNASSSWEGKTRDVEPVHSPPGPIRLADMALCLECSPDVGCEVSRPVDLAGALLLPFGGSSVKGEQEVARHHLGALVAKRRPRSRPVGAARATPTTVATPAGRSRTSMGSFSTCSNATTTRVSISQSPHSAD